MQNTDEELVKYFLAGNEKSFEALVKRYLKPLYNFIFQLTSDGSVAQDLTQEVFVKVWKNLEKFDQEKKFSTWIFAIAKNTTLDWLKKKKPLAFSAFENEEGENWLENVADENILSSNEIFKKMDNAKDAQAFLAALSPQLRMILTLHHQQGFSLSEISQILNSSPNTIKSKYRRTLLELRKNFAAKNTLLDKKFSTKN
jgi:RNA polymerase sigma-70 factor (ECF subfamily)